ncbi:MAG: hypothetical protein LBJ72_12455 [Dysgonamonadaceae bacterium]|jgi:hypothetical protein|nr:hypothetical protein [Dysgonamonadaceae bacterium]
MKAKLILINWLLSFMSLSVDMERSPLWAVILIVTWFVCLCLLLKDADKKGWMNKILKQLKIDEL